MAVVTEKLSALGVRQLSKPGYYGDGAGLWLQVSKTGTKSWIFRYTVSGKQREMGLGPLHTVSLADARARAKDCRLLLLDGKDPIDERRTVKNAQTLARAKRITFEECAAKYIAVKRTDWKNAKHASQWENTLATYASPVIGALSVADIDTDLVVKVLSSIWTTKTETASRLRGRIESILDWATVSKFRQGDNPARWSGHLEVLLADPNKVAPVVHHPSLPWQEVGEFMAALREREGIAARAVEFAILTAVRSGEVRGMVWSEVDLATGVWTIPKERMKAGKEHRVPLSTQAKALLRAMPREGDLVFFGRKVDTSLSDMSLTAVLKRMGRKDITVHGFRSTFRMWCAESVGNSFSREVCEHALAHKLPDKVEEAYQRGDLLAKRAVLMQAWSDYCAATPTAASVSTIHRAAA